MSVYEKNHVKFLFYSEILESAPVQRANGNLIDNWDDPEGNPSLYVAGYYQIILGEMLHDRYHVYQNLGKGVFSSVVKV